MNINVLFDVPAQVAKGLMNGSLERVGGVVRDSSCKQVVMWLQEGGSEVSKALANPPLAGGANAFAAANPLLATANLGVSVAGFAMVLQQLNRISDQIRAVEAKVDRISHKLDDQALAQLKAGINACQNAVELNDPTLRIQMAGQALTTLHAARQFFNQQVVRSAGKAEAASAEYVGLAFVALAAEVQTYLLLDEGEKAARTLRQGLEELRPALIRLMSSVLEFSCYYLRPEFKPQVDFGLVLWLHNGFLRMQCSPGEIAPSLNGSQLFENLRTEIGRTFGQYRAWDEIGFPGVVIDFSGVGRKSFGPIITKDPAEQLEFARRRLPQGLNKIASLVEAHDRLMAQVLQLEEMERLGLKPMDLKQQLLLPEGQAAAVILDPRWIPHKVPA